MRAAGRDADPRHHPRAAGRDVRRARSPDACCRPEPYDMPVFTRVKVHRDYHVEVAKALYSVPEQHLGRLPRRAGRQRAGQALRHQFGWRADGRAAGQDPPAAAAGWPVHRPRGPARAQDRVRAARPVPTDRHLRRTRGEHRHLRRAAARRPAALDPDAQRLPAARPGPPLRPRPGRGRLRTVLDLDVVSVPKIAAMLEKATEHQQPVLPAAAGSPGGRFARDPAEFCGPRSVQLTLIPGGAAASPTTDKEPTP